MKNNVATSQPDGGNTVEINGITYNTSKRWRSRCRRCLQDRLLSEEIRDETLTDMNMGKSETPWPVFRFGEFI